jgi:hypothetical protein
MTGIAFAQPLFFQTPRHPGFAALTRFADVAKTILISIRRGAEFSVLRRRQQRARPNLDSRKLDASIEQARADLAAAQQNDDEQF